MKTRIGIGIGNATKYKVVRDTFAGTTVLCMTGFIDVAEFVANEAVKHIEDNAYASVYIVNTEDGESVKIM